MILAEERRDSGPNRAYLALGARAWSATRAPPPEGDDDGGGEEQGHEVTWQEAGLNEASSEARAADPNGNHLHPKRPPLIIATGIMRPVSGLLDHGVVHHT